ncbi:hypothetical protein BX600DRAFT_460903 [Xylariales sp. PMI_506]|nr:hypothetical protein BX600DRAFT_460903 [Xylariales sp. PMI_506]
MKHKEAFWFDDKEYEERARNMSPDGLWLRQCLKHRKKVSSGVRVGFSSIMLIPTAGVAVTGLWYSGRTLDIARRKEKIIDDEVQRRNLPPYQLNPKDTLIPLGVSMTIGTLSASLEALFLCGGLGAISATGHGLGSLAIAHQHVFLAGAEKNIEKRLDQYVILFDEGSLMLQQPIGVSLQCARTYIDEDGIQYTAAMQEPAVVGGPTQSQITMEAEAVAGATILSSVQGQSIAKLATSADHIYSTPEDTMQSPKAHISKSDSLESGMTTVEREAKKILNEWRQNLLTKATVLNTHMKKIGLNVGMLGIKIPELDQPIEEMAALTLVGETDRVFRFYSRDGQPITQRILAQRYQSKMAEEIKDGQDIPKCRHEYWDKSSVKSCEFCKATIDSITQAYYHCCQCNLDMCEVCVAGRGCGCKHREDEGHDGQGHVLYRKGKLRPLIANLSIIERPKVKDRKSISKSKAKSKEAKEEDDDVADGCSIVLEKH